MTHDSINLRHRLFVATLIAFLAAALVATPEGIGALVWIDSGYIHTIEKTTHVCSLSLDRLDPTCPQCM